MMNMTSRHDPLIVGIDTSNYTTSVACVTADGEILANIKYPLPVTEGERGLRQSDALFAHTKNLPLAMADLTDVLRGNTVAAIGVSARPRNQAGSYMPCFLSGCAAAASMAAVLHVPVYEYSHQCGHMMAALCSSGRSDLLGKTFGAFHVSGGTTDLLRVRMEENGFLAEVVGGARDLHAGQLIDRIGVAMGLPFPCGNALEKLACRNTKKIPQRKISVEGCYANLSGFENMAMDLLRETQDACLTAAFVLDLIGRTLQAMAQAYLQAYGQMPLLFAGGVMCNSLLRQQLGGLWDAAFAEPALSCDNAVGTAELAARAYRRSCVL